MLPSAPIVAYPAFVPLYLAFAAGYLLSYLYRTVNAVISPELSRELGLAPGSLGLLTSAYFVAFAAMQIPVGMLLDRYGPRRVEPVLLAIAAAGALCFALADGLTGLTLARALIGAGVAACLMAPLKAIALWYPPQRQASLAGWIMVAGGMGALAATTPLEFALRFASWRTIFVVLAALTAVVAVWIWFKVPDVPKPAAAPSFGAQWQGVRRVFAHPRFWWIAPLAGFGMGSFMAVQGLWAVPWMLDVAGMTRAAAATHLLAMGGVMLAAYLLLGLFATELDRRGIRTRHLFAAGFALNAVALVLIVANVPGGILWWSLYGLGATANILAFLVLNEGFPRELTARANTAANLVMFVGSFVTQWGIGLVVDAARAALGADTATGLVYAFALVLVLDLVTLAWFALHWKRFAVHAPEPHPA
jgi:predicted MFS family arabinose efflux permease